MAATDAPVVKNTAPEVNESTIVDAEVEAAPQPLVDLSNPADARLVQVADTNEQSSSGLPKVEVAPALAPEAVTTNAGLLRQAVLRTDFTGFFNSPDVETIQRILATVNQRDRKAMEDAYDIAAGKPAGSGTLRAELRERVSNELDYVTTEAMLHRVDGITDDAGNVRVALETAKGDPAKGERLLRAAVSTLDTAQFAAMVQQFDTRYGSFDSSITNATGISDINKSLVLNFFRQGVDGRNKSVITTAAQSVMDAWEASSKRPFEAASYVALFQDVMGGPLDPARKARAELQDKPGFAEQYKAAFVENRRINETVRQVAGDVLREGQISVATIVSGNTGILLGFLDNPDNIEATLLNASSAERAAFATGPQDNSPFYTNIMESFRSSGSPRQVTVWEDMLLHGEKTMVSRIAQTHSDGGMFGIGSGHSMQDVMQGAEDLTARDWERLRDPSTGAAYRERLATSLRTYLTEEEATRVLQLVDAKTDQSVTSFEASQAVVRPLDVFLADNGTPESLPHVARRLQLQSPADLAAIKSNSAVKAQLEAVLQNWPNDDKQIAASVIANSIYRQVSETGKPATLGPTEVFAKGFINDSIGKQDYMVRQALVGELFQDPTLRARMQPLMTAMRGGGASSFMQTGTTEDRSLYRLLAGSATPPVFDAFVQGTEIPPGVRLAMVGGFFSNSGLAGKYPEIAKLPEELRAAKSLSAEQREILDAVVAQDGKADTADRLRSMVIGDGGTYKDFIAEMGALSPEDQARVASEYERKYKGNLKDDVVASVGDDSRGTVAGYTIDQGWKPALVDRLRTFVLKDGGTFSDFKNELSALDYTGMEALKSEYERRYKGSLDNDYMALVPQTHATQYRRYLTPAPTDGRQAYFEQVDQLIRSGVTVDASPLSMERATQLNKALLQQYNAMKQQLPPEAQEAVNQYFSLSFEQYKDSKEKLAETVIIGTVVVAALLAAPATMGMSTAALLKVMPALAVAGAAYRVGMKEAFVGDDFDWSTNAGAKEALHGAVEGVLFAVPGMGGGTRVARAAELPVVTPRVVAEAPVITERVIAEGTTATEQALTQGAALTERVTPVVRERVVAETPAITERVVAEVAETAERVASEAPLAAVAAEVPVIQQIAPVALPSVESVSKQVFSQIDTAVAELRTIADGGIPPIDDAIAMIDDIAAQLRAAAEARAVKPMHKPIVAEPATAEPIIAERTAVTLPTIESEATRRAIANIDAATVEARTAANDAIEVVASREIVAVEPIVAERTAVETAEPIVAQRTTIEVAEPIVAERTTIEVAEPIVAQRTAVEVAEPIVAERTAVEAAEPIVAQRTTITLPSVDSEARRRAIANIDAAEVEARTAADDVIETVAKKETAAAEPVVVERATLEAAEPAIVVERVAAQPAIVAEHGVAQPAIVAERIAPEVPVVAERVAAEVPVITESAMAFNNIPAAATIVAGVTDGLYSLPGIDLFGETATAVPPVVALTVEPRKIEPVIPPVIIAKEEEIPVAKSVEVAEVAPEVPPEVPAVEPSLVPSDKLLALAKVKRGEGPWQVAERILKAAGMPHDVAEIRALTRAFQAVYTDEHNGNGDMSGLKVRYEFIRTDNLTAVIAQLKSQKVVNQTVIDSLTKLTAA